ncbi:hypothetical protein [Methanococcoides methylutens]|uniref:Uncharacterized protein n=1 Tax=Methanococcoides methylutens MM1 TaxID=1434104 RepID=A0A0E3X076_METMT|nr:hypothetical protein [Methanococcoides methylutens]AKB85399.1 hypothetical protein MCMEM_1346 [Methanococcoides methylutens MM1]
MKQNKIDFKDLCPSGRDTKFTKSSSSNLLDHNTSTIVDSDYDLLKAYFKKVNSKELVATLGGLHLFPENQCHTIRLETASRITCALKETGNKKIYRKQLKKILKKGLPTGGDIGLKEDPSENLFTENILFHGGNYVIYSGNSTNDTFILTGLFDTISKNKNAFPIDFVSEIESSSIALLSISNEIVRRMDHTRNMDVVNTWKKDIYIPSDDDIEKSKDAVIFTIQEIDDLFRKYGFNNSILNPFCLHLNDVAFSESDFKDDLFQYFPFIRIEDRLIVSSPSSIVTSIRKFIVKTAKIQSVYSLLFKKFKENMWESVQQYLIALSFLPSSLKLPKFDEEYELNEAIYAIDIDKIAYVQLLVENGEEHTDFNYEKLIEFNYEMSNAEKRLQKLVSERDRQISEFLYDAEKFTNDEILYIKVLCSMEGNFVYSFERKSKQLAIQIDDLKIISMLNDTNCLAFWKYAKAQNEVTLNPISSFLDNFNHYYKNSYSFHIPAAKQNELQKPSIFLLPGSGIELKSKMLQDIDMHGVLIGNPPNYTSVINYNEDKEIPIYIINSLFTGHFYQLIEGYNQPIWVCPDGSYENSNANNEKISLFIDTISYWIWQITPTLRNHLAPLGQNPISIEVSLEESSMWDSFEETKDNIDNLEVNFKWNIIDSKIQLSIPSAIIPVLMKPHNLGERWLLDAILCAFGEMLECNSFTDTLNEDNRNIIVNKHAPFGMKKN